jgi:RimJ/RimL family protein N-acetyltransferase
MPVLIYGQSAALAAWAAAQISDIGDAGFGECVAIGIAAGPDLGDRFYGVVVFHEYQPQAGTIQASAAAISPKWATPGVLRALFAYPFGQLKVQKLWTAAAHDNLRSIRFNEGIGMRREAVLRHHYGRGRHAVMMSMLDTEYRASRWCLHDAEPLRKRA